MKKIVLFCDGTWQDTDSEYPTNITKLKRLLKPNCAGGIEQIAFYVQGIGTRGKIDRLLGGITGHGIEENIRDAYELLCDNFCEGDEIHVLGFSRGAYTARSLVGFIDCVGLLKRSETEKISKLWDIYKDKDDDGLANIALHWTVGKLSKLGLNFNNETTMDKKFKRNIGGKIHIINLTGLRGILTYLQKLIPYCPKFHVRKEVRDTKYSFQTLHRSVLERLKDETCNYKPQNIDKGWVEKLVPSSDDDELYKIE